VPDSGIIESTPAGARRRPGRPSLSNEELLDKALDLFLEKGFAGTSIDAVCAAAGMAKRTVYARYGDKETLFKAALNRAIEEWLVPVETLRAQETDDLEDTLVRIGTILVENVLSPAGLRLLRLTNAESVSMPEIAMENVRLGTEPTLFYLADLFRLHLGGAERDFAEAEEAAQAFLNLVVGGPASNAAWGKRFEPSTVERHIRFSVRLFLHGVSDRAPPRQERGLTDLLTQAEESVALARARLEQVRRLVELRP
jgi:AcrR family transcriptional regulator